MYCCYQCHNTSFRLSLAHNATAAICLHWQTHGNKHRQCSDPLRLDPCSGRENTQTFRHKFVMSEIPHCESNEFVCFVLSNLINVSGNHRRVWRITEHHSIYVGFSSDHWQSTANSWRHNSRADYDCSAIYNIRTNHHSKAYNNISVSNTKQIDNNINSDHNKPEFSIWSEGMYKRAWQ